MTRGFAYIAPVAIPPGRTLLEVLQNKEMTQEELSKRINCSHKHVNQIVNGKAAISSEIANRLGYALGIPASFWINLEAKYQDTKARLADQEQMAKETRLVENFRYNEASRRGWVKTTRSRIEKVAELRRFLGVSSLSRIDNIYAVSFRVSNCRSFSPEALTMWLRQGEIASREIRTADYDEKMLREKLRDLRQLSLSSDSSSIEAAKRILAECGIALIIVEHLTGSNAVGAAMKVRSDKYVVEMSFRGKYADIFWFSLFHEIGHILHKHVKDNWSIDFDIQTKCLNLDQAQEDEANAFARQVLIDDERYREFTKSNDFSEQNVRRFAEAIEIHPGVVVGRLCSDKFIPYSALQHLRSHITH